MFHTFFHRIICIAIVISLPLPLIGKTDRIDGIYLSERNFAGRSEYWACERYVITKQYIYFYQCDDSLRIYTYKIEEDCIVITNINDKEDSGVLRIAGDRLFYSKNKDEESEIKIYKREDVLIQIAEKRKDKKGDVYIIKALQ